MASPPPGPTRGRWLELLAAAAPIGLGVIDAELRFVAANECLGRAARAEPGRMIGVSVGEIANWMSPRAIDALRAVATRGERLDGIELTTPGPSSSEPALHWIASAFPLVEDGAPVGAGLVLRSSATVRDAEARLAVIAMASKIVGASLDLETTLGDLARVLVPRFGDFATVDMLDEPIEPARVTERMPRTVAVVHANPAKIALAQELRNRLPLVPEQPLMDVLRSGRPALFPEIDEALLARSIREPARLAAARELGMRSGVIVPLLARGLVLGAITLVSTTERPRYGEEDVQLLEEIAARAALAIENARLHGEVARHAERLGALLDASRNFAESGLELGAVLERASQQLDVLLGDVCVVRLLSEDGAALVTAAVHHADEGVRTELRRRIGPVLRRAADPPYGGVLARGEALLAPHLTPELRLSEIEPELADVAAELGFDAVLVAPLRARARAIGTVAVARARHGRPFDLDDRRLLQDLADRAALAIENARLYQAELASRREAERAAARTFRLQSVTAALSDTKSPPEVLDVVLAHGFSALGARSGAIYLLTEDATQLDLAKAVGVRGTAFDRIRRVSIDDDLPPSEAARHGRPIFVETSEERAARWPALGPTLDDATWAVVPLIVHGRVLGTLAFAIARSRPMHPDDRDFMIALARQCAQALDRVRLQEAQRIAAERMSLLADASTVLAASLDLETTLRNAARLCVPTIANACVVATRVDGAPDAATFVAVAHVEPAREAILSPLLHKRVRAAGGRNPLFEVLNKGRALLAQSPRSALIPQGVEGIAPDVLQTIVDELDVHTAILVPLVARGQVLGVIGLGRSGRAPDFQQEDLAFAEELARRAALAVDNARLYRDAENAVRLREDFLSIAGHELKTPLTALQLQARSLERGARGDERTLEKLRVVVRQGHRLTKLVDQLLDVSRITGGKLSLDREEVDLASLVRDVAARFEDDLARSGSSLCLEVDPNATGRWDRLRVDQVVTNLISNAIKYGQGHPIDVAVEGGSSDVVLRVRDRGMGVAPEHQARIFGRFERAVSSRHYGGFGLGLWIVRQIVEAHGGTIVVQSEPGEGSTFTVRLPRNTDERAAE